MHKLLNFANQFLKEKNISKDYLKKESGGLCWWFAKNFSKYLDSKGVKCKIIDMKSNKKGNHMVVKVDDDFIDFTMNQFKTSEIPAIYKKEDYDMFSKFEEFNSFDDRIKSWKMTSDEWKEYEKKLKHPGNKGSFNEQLQFISFKNWLKTFEGVGDKYGLKLGVPDDTQYREDIVLKQNIKEADKVVFETAGCLVVKNPESLKNFKEDIRAVFSKEGDLFVASNRNIVHSLMVEELVRANEITNQEKWWWRNPKEFITLQRVGDTNSFAVGESNDTMDPDLDEHGREHHRMPYFEECEAYFQDFIDLANKNHPQYKFINKHVKYLDY